MQKHIACGELFDIIIEGPGLSQSQTCYKTVNILLAIYIINSIYY